MSNRARQRARAAAAHKVLEQRRAAERRRRTLFTSALVGALLLLAGIVGYGVYVAQRPDDVRPPAGAVDQGTGLAVGDGPVKVEIYLDFLCPACREYEEQAGPVLQDYVDEGRITVVYHPLNFLDRLSSTDYSTRSAAAAASAADAGKLTEYVTALYQRQPPENSAGLSDDELVAIGRDVGIMSSTFEQDVKSERYHEWVEFVTGKADERGVRGTPTVYVDGKQVDNTVRALTAAVEAA
jgi:protein-disulfide isomerase